MCGDSGGSDEGSAGGRWVVLEGKVVRLLLNMVKVRVKVNGAMVFAWLGNLWARESVAQKGMHILTNVNK